MDRKRRLMENNNGWPLRNQLFDGAPIALPLTHTVIGRGGLTPSFTRATTATVTDNEGILRTAIAGEARFVGARRVRNLVSFSEDLTNAVWFVGAGATKSGNTVTLTAAESAQLVRGTLIPTTVGNTYIMSVKMSTNSGEMSVRISRTDGTTWATASVSPTLTVTTTPTVFSLVYTAVGAANSDFIIGGDSKTPFSPTAGDIVIEYCQLEDITGRTDQTTPSEYVSVGVLSSPWHGAGVDGVKYFNTSLTGAAIPAATNLGYLAEAASTNLAWPSEDLTHVRYVSGGGGIAVVADQAVAPDGTTTADQLTATGANGTLIQDLGVIASAARNFSIYLKRKTGTGSIDLTLDGGATWTTKAITTTEWTRVDITQTLANPDIGIRIVTSGDAIYAWGVQCE